VIVATDVYLNLEYEFNSMKGMLGKLLGFLAIGPIFAFLVGGFVMPEFVSFVSDPVPYMDVADLISTSSLYSTIGVLGVFAMLLFFGDAVPKGKRLLWFFVLLLGNILVFPVFWFIYYRNWPADAHATAQLTG
jgi:hypothetical protein